MNLNENITRIFHEIIDLFFFAFQIPPPTISNFSELLAQHPAQFHNARTPRSLQHFWQGLKQYTLLPDQSVQPYVSRDNHILNFLDAEASISEVIDQGIRMSDLL